MAHLWHPPRFHEGLLAAGAVLPVSAAAYFGYEQLHGKPVKAGLIGAGDEGGVLVGEHNPEYLEFIAFSDIRPSNQKRIFTASRTADRARASTTSTARTPQKNIKLYDDYKELLANKDIEAVVIALPLHLHAPVAIDAMKAGKHVLCEKLMAWNITQCKEMIKRRGRDRPHPDDRPPAALQHALRPRRRSARSPAISATSSTSAPCGIATTPGPMLDKQGQADQGSEEPASPVRDSWRPADPRGGRDALEDTHQAARLQEHGRAGRWRLYNRTGGGLMAELGSHQLDACSIFLGKVHPLAVSGVGGKYFYQDDREVDDHVFVTFEFPGKNYCASDKRRRSTSWSSPIRRSAPTLRALRRMRHGLEGHAGRRAWSRRHALPGWRPAVATTVTVSHGGRRQAGRGLDSTAGPSVAGKAGHWSDRRRRRQPRLPRGDGGLRLLHPHVEPGPPASDRRQPRCHGRVAMADAIIALTANQAMSTTSASSSSRNGSNVNRPPCPTPDMKTEIIA